MIILVYTKFNSGNIQDNLGLSEYSYYFVLQKFLPVLRAIGQVHTIADPVHEVDEYFEQAKKEGLKCMFLCFAAPHNLFFGLKCPTIPVFAWEYDTIPNESWDGNENNNWVQVLKKLGAAITHSDHSAEVIRSELGEGFPVISCPAPIETHSFTARQQISEKSPVQQYEVMLTKEVIDSASLDLGQLSSEKGMAERIQITHVLLQRWSHEVLEELIPKGLYQLLRHTYLLTGTLIARSLRALSRLGKFWKLARSPFPQSGQMPVAKALPGGSSQNDSPSSTVSGIIYTSVLNIYDGRKNYKDMVAAFCHALHDKPDAALILKAPVMDDLYFFKEKVISFLNQLPDFNCRVVVMGYYLDSDAYLNLMKATAYYVNTSYGEGQCLPLMEYMAAGVPAIAPQSAALSDYVRPSNSFILKTSAVPTFWQHDERRAIRTVHHRPDWYSLVEAYRASYQLAKNDPGAYREMSLAANATLRKHCSSEKAKEKLKGFLIERLRGQLWD